MSNEIVAMSASLEAFMRAAVQKDVYWFEKIKIDFALALDRQRKESNLTIKQMSARSGISTQYIGRILRGDANPSLETVVRLARSVRGEATLSVGASSLEQ